MKFLIFQGDVHLHNIYKSARQDGLNDLFSGKMNYWESEYFHVSGSTVLCFFLLFNSIISMRSILDMKKIICAPGDLPEPALSSRSFSGAKVVHWRKKRQVCVHMRFWIISVIEIVLDW